MNDKCFYCTNLVFSGLDSICTAPHNKVSKVNCPSYNFNEDRYNECNKSNRLTTREGKHTVRIGNVWKRNNEAWLKLADYEDKEEDFVYCKDCKYFICKHYEDVGEPEYVKKVCELFKRQLQENDYCSKGERK